MKYVIWILEILLIYTGIKIISYFFGNSTFELFSFTDLAISAVIFFLSKFGLELFSKKKDS